MAQPSDKPLKLANPMVKQLGVVVQALAFYRYICCPGSIRGFLDHA